MGARKREKQQPVRQKAIRGPAPLSHLHHLPPTQLQDVKTSAASEIERLRAHVKQTQATIADLQQMEQLIDRLYEQRGLAPPDGTGLRHAEAAVAVLTAVGHPMQLKDLLAAMAARGAVVAGKTERQRRSNLIITLSRSALVRRVGHGLYALTESRASA